MPLRLKVSVLVIAIVLSLGAAMPAVAGAPTAYELEREGFRVSLVFAGNRLVHLRIWVRERCSDGTSPVRRYNERDLSRVAGRGGFVYEGGYSTEYGYEETRLSVHLVPGGIKGAFRDIDTEVGYYLCATGHRGQRTLKFTARRVGG